MAGKDVIMLHQRELKRLHVIHKSRGKPSNRSLSKKIKDKASP